MRRLFRIHIWACEQLVEERFLFTTPKYTPNNVGYNPRIEGLKGGPQHSEPLVRVGVRAIAQAEPNIQRATPRIHESKIKVHNKIGTGSVATVYAGTYESHKVAIKKHSFEHDMDAKAISDLEMEVGKMTAVNHPCIVRCFGLLEPTAGKIFKCQLGRAVARRRHLATSVAQCG